MRFIKVVAENFSSYNKLEFDFSDTGLSLIHGPTGAGKSTLMDLPCWALFGITAKDGNVDEIRSWNSPNSPTTVTLDLTIDAGTQLSVTRIRGTQKQNDLYFTENGLQIRGKDTTETQQLLNNRLGVTAELFLRAAYFSEFSPTGAFFMAKAKDRKQLFEIITDLSFPILIQQKANDKKIVTKKKHLEVKNYASKLSAKSDQLVEFIADTNRKHTSWIQDRKVKIKSLELQSNSFEETKTSQIAALELKESRWNEEHLRKLALAKGKAAKLHPVTSDAKCPTCGNLDESVELHNLKISQVSNEIQRLEQEVNPYITQVASAKVSVNTFSDKIEYLTTMNSPFEAQLVDLENQKVKLAEEAKTTEEKSLALDGSLNRLENLQSIAQDLKSHLLHNSIQCIQDNVNKYLEDYFESQFTITFTIQDDSDLDIQIFKNGHVCVYTQLSKGQRGLLKLVFSVAVMQAASNTSGVHFDNLFFDEPTDGTDNDLKTKSYRLFEELSKTHQSVLIIDHSDSLKNLFNNQYEVELVGDSSEISKYE